MNRRNFIKNIALTAGSFSPILRIGGGLGLLSTTSFAEAQSFEDYKAIVIINFDGGNDSMNMFVPTQTDAHETYADIRRDLAVLSSDLYADQYYQVDENQYFQASLGINQPYYKVDPDDPTAEINENLMYTKGSYHTTSTVGETAVSTGLGINALMPEFASLFNKNRLSIVSNVGTLVEPTTKEMITNDTANLPVFLFAHNHQGRAVDTAQAETLAQTGWAGRLADNWQVNGAIGLNISYAGARRMFIGTATSGLAMKTSGPTSYPSMSIPIEDILIRFADNTTNTNHFDRYYNSRNKTTAQLSTSLTTAWASAPDFSTFTAKNSYGENLFTQYENNHKENLGMLTHHGTKSDIIEQLEAVAKMVKLTKDTLAHKRQIFYVNAGGYDSHSDQFHHHSRNLRTISLSISDFYKALEEMGLEQNVLLVSTSEFGRTLKSNGDGTDHGWGGHSFMLSGDTTFNGGQVFGEVMTDLSIDGSNAYTDRARMIPTTSIEQMMAPALKWFGVDNSLINTVLPNLNNFRTTDTDEESSFLQGVFSV